jgi:hypothetical protein
MKIIRFFIWTFDVIAEIVISIKYVALAMWDSQQFLKMTK